MKVTRQYTKITKEYTEFEAEFCCENIKNAIKYHGLYQDNSSGEVYVSLRIDNFNHDSIRFKFCPFCGKRIKYYDVKVTQEQKGV